MRILLVTSHFYPESFKANDMAFELAKRGHDVTVLAPIPDYPQGKYFDGYGVFKKRREVVNGVKVIRTLVTPRRDGSTKWLFLNYLTHTLFSTLRGIYLGLFDKFDTVLVHETSPVMIGIPAVLVKKLMRVPMHFWVLDLWPESLEAAGGIHNKGILNIFRHLTKWMYNNSKTILISSKGFSKSINSIGNYTDRIEYFPNWIDIAYNGPSPEVQDLPAGFNVMIAGNIGEAQDIPHVIEAARMLNGKSPINFIFLGDGRRKNYIEDAISKYQLTNVYLLGRFPINYMPAFFAKADMMLLSLKDEPIFSLTVPARLQNYMSSGKPVVAMINGEGADLIKESDCGWSVKAEDSEGLARLLEQLAESDKSILDAKGLNGLKYSRQYFDLNKCIDHLESVINSK